jgi:3-oxoacyl-[acyl-carrier protein] reductase
MKCGRSIVERPAGHDYRAAHRNFRWEIAMKTVLITGCSSGYGLATARHFLAQGWKVFATMRTPREDILPQSERLRVLPLDVTNSASIAAALDVSGPIDVLVNNAGITRDKLMRDMSAADFDAVVNLNLRGTFLCCKYGTPPMVAKKWGRVINMSSRAHLGNKGQTNYSASKAGVIGLTRSLALELGKFGVTCNCIAPGVIATPGVTSLPHYQSLVERVAPTLPIPRLGKPEDVAGVAAFLASDDASYVTGAVVPVDGGWSAM